MKHEIDLWGAGRRDRRWDRDRNAEILNIVFAGGTFGNFLKLFLDKFSNLSPNISGDAFTNIGTSRSDQGVPFSGLFQAYHCHFINDNKGLKGLPICLILPSTEKHFLYLKKAQWFRPDNQMDRPDHLWQKAVGEMPEELRRCANEIIKLYEIKETAHFSWIPKFIVRDWYKLEFLQDIKETYNYQWFDALRSHEFFDSQNVFHLDLETFFNWEVFYKNIKALDEHFKIGLDFDRDIEMKQMFDKGLSLDEVRKESNRIERMLYHGVDIDLRGLDVATEGFIYAHLEKQNPEIQMPLTNRFFRDFQEIKQFIEHFPSWYRRSNPNLG